MVNPKILPEDLKSLEAADDIILNRLAKAENWDQYWKAYSDLMDHCINNISPGSGILFTPRIFAARKGILPSWDVNLGLSRFINLQELIIYPPEYEDPKYQSETYEK
jgi:hypothetical protein